MSILGLIATELLTVVVVLAVKTASVSLSDEQRAFGRVDGIQDSNKLDATTGKAPYNPKSNDPSYIQCNNDGHCTAR